MGILDAPVTRASLKVPPILDPAMTAAQIQTVLDARQAAGGGAVIARPGDYSIGTTLLLPYRVHLIAEGFAGYNQSTGFGGGSAIFNDVNFILANGVNGSLIRPKKDKVLPSSYFQQNSVLHGICFMGNQANNTMDVNVGLVHFDNVMGLFIRGCSVVDSKRHGIILNRSIAGAIEDCSALNNTGAGIYLFGDADDNIIANNAVGTNVTGGIDCVGGSQLRIIGNKPFNNGGNGGIILRGGGSNGSSFGNLVVGNNVDDNNVHGIYLLDSLHNVVQGNIITRNANAGICLATVTDGANYNTIQGNSSGNVGTGTKQDYGIQIDANADFNKIVGNDFTNNTTAPMLLSTTGTANNEFNANAGLSSPGFGFPYSCDPRDNFVVATLGAANRCFYVRTLEGGLISKIALHVGTASGNISVGVHRNTGVGRASRPGARAATSDAVACPATGYQEVALTTPVWVQPGDWLCLSADNNTASFGRIYNALGDGLGNGLAQLESTAHPCPATAAGAPAVLMFTLVGVA